MVDGDGFFRHQLAGNDAVLAHQRRHAMAERLKFSGPQLTGPALATHQGYKGLGGINSQAPAISFPLEGEKIRPTTLG